MKSRPLLSRPNLARRLKTSEKPSKPKKKVESSDGDSTDEETAMMVRNFKKFMKKRNFKRGTKQKNATSVVKKFIS